MIIKPIQVRDKRDLKAFIELPYEIYKNDRNWVAPLRVDIKNILKGKDNPLFSDGEYQPVMVYIGSKAVGRICVGIDRKINGAKHLKEGYITLFECINDYKVAEALLDYSCQWLKERGMTIIKGPISPTKGDDYRGMLVDGFDSPPVLMNSYNPRYYISFFERYGFYKYLDLFAYRYDLKKPLPDKLKNIVDFAQKKYNFIVDRINLKNIQRELADIKKILDISVPEEWEDLAPPSMEEIQAWGRKLVPVAEPNLIYIARSEGQPIGFSIALPDYNQVLIHMKGKWLPFGFIKYLLHKSKIKGGRIFILFVVPEFRKKGVTAAIYYKSMSWAQQRGYIYGEGSTIGETNLAMRRDAERVGGVHYKTYRIYQYSIGQ